jgi:hypothetical protein
MRAYGGDVPIPYYWQLPSGPPRPHGRRHPGEIATTHPYGLLPPELGRSHAVSLEQLEELVERLARREELSG